MGQSGFKPPLLKTERRKYQFLFSVVAITAVTGTSWGLLAGGAARSVGFGPAEKDSGLRQEIQKIIRPSLKEAKSGLPTEIRLPSGRSGASEGGQIDRLVLQYTLDPDLQGTMERLFKQYNPDYGAFAAIDPDTGAVLAMVSHSADPKIKENLAIRATFPSASIFKVVTAAAALSKGGLSPESVISFTGANHTLYKSQILKNETSKRWTRHMTLKEAFGRSVNTVFGRLGAHRLGAVPLRDFADRFGFDQKLGTDIPIENGHAEIQNDAWELAEAASGFTQDNTMSPVQGALIAAVVANGGKMMEPYLIASAHKLDGTPVYTAQPQVIRQAIDDKTADGMKTLMRSTITQGTSRKTFRGFARGVFKVTEVGGKTGSLTGDNPKGKVDWFVGYADHRGKRIAVAALTINEKLWRVKSSWLARRSMETYIKSQLQQASVLSSELDRQGSAVVRR